VTAPKPFRFGIQANKASSAKEWTELARKTESLGYSTLTMPDHFDEQLAPVPALMLAAAATTTLRIGTLVFDNDYRHPVVLAKECATLDLLSEGRLEIGLGAGWLRTDYEQVGLAYDAPAVRVERCEEAVAVLKGHFSEGPFTYHGKHYRVTEHDGTPKTVQRPHPPILIGGGAPRMLRLAGREADIVGINPTFRAGAITPEGVRDIVAANVSRKIDWVREGAGPRFDQIEIQTRAFVAQITDDPVGLAGMMAPGFGLTAEEALDLPIALVGRVQQCIETLQARRERWGYSYIVFGPEHVEMFAPVVAALAGT
jgi:probable F420-dependent oxidoreductase